MCCFIHFTLSFDFRLLLSRPFYILPLLFLLLLKCSCGFTAKARSVVGSCGRQPPRPNMRPKLPKPLLEAVSRQFSQTHLSFCIKPPDFAKECSTNNCQPQVSRKCVQTPTHQAEHKPDPFFNQSSPTRATFKKIRHSHFFVTIEQCSPEETLF